MYNIFVFGCTRSSLHSGLSLTVRGERGLLAGCDARALGTWASAVVVQGLSCPMACGIFQTQGSNSRPLHWQAGSCSVYHQGGPPILS